MPPKGVARAGLGRPAQSNSYVRSTINEITNPENRSVVIAVSFFAAGVAFLHSSWSEALLPPI